MTDGLNPLSCQAANISRFRVCRGVRGGVLMMLCAAVLALGAALPCRAEREILSFNPGWKFIKSDLSGAAAPGFDDRGWSDVCLPHTYNAEDTFDDWSLSGHRGEQQQWSGRTWYRKTFAAEPSMRGKRVFLEFEAVRQVAEVYLNGTLVGVSRTGFTPFGFDLTPLLRFDSPNVLAVSCDNRFMKDPWEADGPAPAGKPGQGGKAGGKLAELAERFNAEIPEELSALQADQIPWNNPHWHPAHGGIYRNVYLHLTDPLHISLPLYSFLQTAGPYAYATGASDSAATVNVEVPVENGRRTEEEVEVQVRVRDAAGQVVAVMASTNRMAAGTRMLFEAASVVVNPQFWAPESPCVYTVVCTVLAGGKEVDRTRIPLGIRTALWDAQKGLHLNGRPLKLHGWGQKPTQEWPGLGAAIPDWMHFLTLQMMRDAGANMVRWGHCAGPPAGVTAADRLGLITVQPGVDGESDTRGAAWKMRSAAFRDTLIYFRNNPSILVWEGGNQKVSREHAAELRTWVDRYDPQGGRAYAHRRADATTAEFMDVGLGTEGGREIAHLAVIEGEYNREEAPRRIWDHASPPRFGYPEAAGQTYQLTSEQFAVNQVFHYVTKLGKPDHCGGANWIFSDSTSGGRVACEVARASGEVDAVRLPKEAYYVCQAMFRSDPQVHLIGHWTYPEATTKTVYAAANSDEVELFVNGRSLGRVAPTNRFLFCFPAVKWEPGEVRVVAYLAGKAVAWQTKRTASRPVALRLTPVLGPGGWRADGGDVAVVDVEAVDAAGDRCPTFQERVHFEVEGPAQWLGGYESGRTNSIWKRDLALECGINRVALRSSSAPGAVLLRARCAGLETGSIELVSHPSYTRNGITRLLPGMPPARIPLGGPAGTIAASPQALTTHLSPDSGEPRRGRFITAFSYSGPTPGVGIKPDAASGRRIYLDRDVAFESLPGFLQGADYIQAADSDRTYDAVDLMELSVRENSMISVAHDDRLPRPSWLRRLFKPTGAQIYVGTQPMSVFQRLAGEPESLTLGPNCEATKPGSCNMYVVFVHELRARAGR